MKHDTLKILELIHDQKEIVTKLQSRINHLEGTSSDTRGATESYQEGLDKILSDKLDELAVKVDKKITELNQAILSTRDIAIIGVNRLNR